MNRFVNLNILMHPVNWFTVLLFMLLFAMTVHILEPLIEPSGQTSPQGKS